jgi:two-component system sensor histidine kinase/response regulator
MLETVTVSEHSQALADRAAALAGQQQELIYRRTDRLFAGLMVFQWLAGIAAALWISPQTWAGPESRVHLHVWAALYLGGAITSLPVWLALTQPGSALTRHAIAVGQMLTSALLIHLTGGRIETHFHVFGSLAFLAFYRDWRVFVSATVVVAADHFVRGVYWPQSVYGVLAASPWRWLEHAGWVLFEDVFLIGFCLQGVRDLQQMAERQARLEISEAVMLNAKTAAEEANLAKSQFLANMSHELRTPMNAILGFSEILQDQTFGELNKKQARYVENILTSGRHLLELINSILDLSKVEAGRMELDRCRLDAASALRGVESIVKPLAAKKRIELTTRIGASIPVISADEAKLKQILYNLLSNAIKFTPEQGQVTASVEWQDSWLQISVSDTGIGVRPEDQERIFREFEQVDSSYSRRQQGTGLGLALARKLAELHGGRLWVESAGEGKGSTFRFVLPAPPAAVAAPEPNASPARTAVDLGPGDSAAKPPLVLVVEDDSHASELLVHYLSEGGYAIAQAFDGRRSVEMAKELRPCVITLDIMLPEKGGLQVLAELKADPETRDIPVVVISISQERPSAFRLGAADYLEKPVDRERLLEVVGRARAAKEESDTAVLVVYDEPGAVGRLIGALSTHGFQVLPTDDCRQQGGMAPDAPPQVVVLDLRWPETPAESGERGAGEAVLSPADKR